MNLLLAILSLTPAVEIARRCLEEQKARQLPAEAAPAPEPRRKMRRSRKRQRTGGPGKRGVLRKSGAVGKPLHALRAP